ALTGELAIQAGRIVLADTDVSAAKPHERARLGLQRTFQVNSLFPDLSAQASVVLSINEREGLGGHWWRGARPRTHIVGGAAAVLARLGLDAMMHRPVRAPAYGQQRLLELALALARRPSVLLLDESAAGLPAGQRAGLLEVLEALPNNLAI